MLRGILMILASMALMGGVTVLGGQKWESRKVDLSHLPEDPTLFDCKEIAKLYDKEVEALARDMAQQAFAPPTASGTRFISAGGFGTGVKAVSKADGHGFGGTQARESLLDKVDRYLNRECRSGGEAAQN
ncbi:hypothetical protein C8J30_101638 [Rhodobacter viridis]|uniref:Uncharacterized protein n=1 Tax=Rhodobacter viridis TaxID=1054202 RepID=A0A318U5A7_9RHOB|nr:hypothetical protein [Rhodobacter viridis]PYF13249.1 hypothetical protein C8J30_101638 [Rhodobacter viridis]